jgi:hypothetical protein
MLSVFPLLNADTATAKVHFPHGVLLDETYCLDGSFIKSMLKHTSLTEDGD